MRYLWLFLLLLLPAQADVTTFWLVRHAEQVSGKGDVALSTEGHQRAWELRETLRTVPITTVYTTELRRARETAEPIAQAGQLKPALYPGSLPATAELLKRHKGEDVLVVGHSNTVPEMVKALSGQTVDPIAHTEYDRLYQVQFIEHKGSTSVSVFPHRYGELRSAGRVEFQGELNQDSDLSALVLHGTSLVVGSDEEDAIQILDRVGPRHYKARAPIPLENNGELDIEAMVREGNTYYVLGSHSSKRKKVGLAHQKSLKRDYQKNREALTVSGVEDEPARDRLYRFTLNLNEGTLSKKGVLNLHSWLAKNPVLGPFLALPSKENGVDFEGMALNKGRLYLGCRGPVLREGFVPVLVFNYERPEEMETVFVNLQGRGIRELVAVDDGFLILGGPVGDSDLSYRLYHWDGKDCLPGQRAQGEPTRGRCLLLGTVPSPPGGKPEGFAVMDFSKTAYRLLVIYDGIQRARPLLFKVGRGR